jgi:riboflavin kinase/FMN adenylyltransferase
MATRVFHGSSDYPEPSPRPVVTVGNFDGVHLGHQALLAATKRRAAQSGVPACAYTFDPSPVQILRPDVAPQRLQRIEDRIDMLMALGMDHVVVEPFNRQLAAMSPEVFASEVLLSRLQPSAMVVGWDFRFGEQRKGTCRDLQELLPCAVEQIEAVEIEGDVVSSSRIRRLLAAGQVGRIPALLGRPQQIVGPVIHGQARGRQLGFPTANLALEGVIHPPAGVYAVRARLPEGPELPGVANLGKRPTFGGRGVALEVHLLDWSGELYGVELRVDFIARLRAEQTFASPQHLVEQIQMDIEHARERLS